MLLGRNGEQSLLDIVFSAQASCDPDFQGVPKIVEMAIKDMPDDNYADLKSLFGKGERAVTSHYSWLISKKPC